MPDQALQAERVRLLFDAKAAAWPAKYAPGGPLAGRLASLARAVRAGIPPGSRVLDLGCGTGELARSLARAGLKTAGCDISGPMLQGAAARDPGRTVGWVQLDPCWRQLPFAAAAFDAAVAASVLEYAADPLGVLRECARVLRPAGVVVCTVPDLRHPVRWLEWLAWAIGRTPARALGRRWPRWDAYQAYLRASRQRHRARWWLAAARAAGLRPAGPACSPAARLRAGGRCQALRLLAFRLPGESGLRG
jgi:SAM-dependent methyltransferase